VLILLSSNGIVLSSPFSEVHYSTGLLKRCFLKIPDATVRVKPTSMSDGRGSPQDTRKILTKYYKNITESVEKEIKRNMEKEKQKPN